MSTGFEVTVDGEKFPKDRVTVTIGGKTYTQEDMTKIGNVQWPNYEAAILTVTKPGGLKPGYTTWRLPGGTGRPTSPAGSAWAGRRPPGSWSWCTDRGDW